MLPRDPNQILFSDNDAMLECQRAQPTDTTGLHRASTMHLLMQSMGRMRQRMAESLLPRDQHAML